MAPHKIVIGFEPQAGFVERARTALPGTDLEMVVAPTSAAVTEALGGADVLFGGRITPEQLQQARSLKWIQTNSAGVEHLPAKELKRAGVTVTNASGAHGAQISEHILAMMLAFARQLHSAIRAQDRREWLQLTNTIFELEGKVLGIIGLGDLGLALAEKAKALGLSILASKVRITTKPVCVDEIFGPEGIDEILTRSDFVADTLPLTPNTRHLFDMERFRRMKRTAYFFNAGRGGTVKQQDLIAALANGLIAGAGLDVTDPEPLPADSPLWAMPNVILTAHYSGWSPHVMDRTYRIFLDNLRRYHEGRTLANVVDLDAGY